MGGAAPITAEYPTYLQGAHAALLTGTDFTTPITNFNEYGNIFDATVAASSGVGGSPYAAIEAYDPSEDVEAVQERYDAWTEDLDAIDVEQLIADWAVASTTAAAYTVPTSEIDGAVDAFEARSQAAFMRNVSRFAVGMWDIGAVMSTQYGMGLASMELDRQEQLNDMDSRLRLLAERERFETSRTFTGEMARLYMAKLQEQRAGIGGRLDIARIGAALYQDQIGLNLGYEIKDATWDIELYQAAMGNIGALSGAIQTYKAQTPGERLAAAITTSGSFGLQVGTALGSPVAGVIGGVGMLATQLLTGLA